MNITDSDIRLAIERRLSALDNNAARHTRILRRIEREEESHVKKKLSLGLVLAIVLILVFATVALALTTNLFNFFGKRNDMYDKVADKAQLLISEPLVLQRDGTVTACFDSALYDGMTLNAALMIDRPTLVEEYTPDDGALSSMRLLSELPASAFSYGAEHNAQALISAMETGAPYGYRVVQYCPSDYVLTDDGIEIPPFTGDPMTDEYGRYVEMRQFEPLLPVELRNLDAITLNCAIMRIEYIWYFDGEALYYKNAAEEAGVMRAAAQRGAARAINMTGAINAAGITLTARAEVSEMSAVVTIEASENASLGDLFGEYAIIPSEIDPSDIWAEIAAYDDKGRAYRSEYFFSYPNQTLPLTQAFTGVGELPERIELHIRLECEGDTEISAQPIIIPLAP